MSSPLAQFYNTILSIPDTATVGINDNGDPILIPGLEVDYKAYLKVKSPSKEQTLNYSVGVDSHKQFFVGYLVEPTALPNDFILPATVKCRKRRGQNDLWIDGTFEIVPEYLPIAIVEDVLGDAIAGYFQVLK